MAPELQRICHGEDPADVIPNSGNVPRDVYIDEWVRQLAEMAPAGTLSVARAFIEEWRRHRANGSPKATDKVKAVRLMICESCDVLDPESRKCRSCGCPVDRKTGWADSDCPLGEWSEVVAITGT